MLYDLLEKCFVFGFAQSMEWNNVSYFIMLHLSSNF